MSAPRETTEKRLRIRAWRRGTREMDLVLGGFADAALAGLSDEALAGFDRLLEENDQDIYAWISGRTPAPEAHKAILAEIGAHLAASDFRG
ncbi:MAG: succinate dehydrogenase assembly factor 2 [Pseudomonadota bacterium]